MIHQPSLLDVAERVEKPRKAVRKISRQNYAELRDSGQLGERAHAVLTAMAHRYYVTQEWPTASELCRWMFQHGKIPRESLNLVAPRISDLVNGETRRVKGVQVRSGGGVCELLQKRICAVSGTMAHPIRIREAGSALNQFGYGGTK